MISSFFSFFVKMMRMSISTKYKNKKKLSHFVIVWSLFIPYNRRKWKRSIYHMIKQNQTYLNRLHVVMDAVCIYFAGFAAWYIRFKCTIFGFWLNQEIFDLNRYYPEFYQYQCGYYDFPQYRDLPSICKLWSDFCRLLFHGDRLCFKCRLTA